MTDPPPDNRLQRFLRGHRFHHFQRLPRRLPRPLEWLLARRFEQVRFGADQAEALRRAADGARLVYVTRHASALEALFAYVRFRRLGLPCPTLTPGLRFRLLQPLGHVARVLVARLVDGLHLQAPADPLAGGDFARRMEAGETVWLPLVTPRNVFSRPRRDGRDPVTVLVAARGVGRRPVVAVPVLMFYSRWPGAGRFGWLRALLGPLQPPGRLRRLATLLFHPSRAFMEVGLPLAAESFPPPAEGVPPGAGSEALTLRRELLARLERLQRSVTGPVPQTPLAAEHAVLTSAPLQTYLIQSARRRNMPLYRAQREAAAYLREIAARPSPLAAAFGMWLAGRLVRRMFDGLSINPDRLRRVHEAAMEGPVVFVPCHRSHMDTPLIGLALHHHNISLPLVFAGDNLAFWPLGPLARRMGAFFVRRRFQGRVLYARVMAAYVRWLLAQRYNVLVYVEGTRSRSGRLLPPQLGMLAMLLQAARDEDCREVHFVPVHIGYDRVPEDRTYLHETRGGPKPPESARQLLRLGRVLKRRYGRIYLKFGEPLSLRRAVEEGPAPLEALTNPQVNDLCRRLSGRIMDAIDRATVITPHGLTAGVLLAGGRTVRNTRDVETDVEALLSYAVAVDLQLADSLQLDPMVAVRQALADFERRRWIEPTVAGAPGGRPSAFRIPASRRLALSYYRNTILARFVPAAATALLILARESFQFPLAGLSPDDAALQGLLAADFPSIAPPAARWFRRTVKAFITDAILVPHPTLPDTYRLTAAGHHKLRLFAGLLAATLETHAVVLDILTRPDGFRHPAREPGRRLRAAAMRRARRGEALRPEALARDDLAGAATFFARQGIRGPDDVERSAAYRTLLRRQLEFLRP